MRRTRPTCGTSGVEISAGRAIDSEGRTKRVVSACGFNVGRKMSKEEKLPAGNSIRDRVKELRRVPASQLKANAKNWRKHPQEQRDALRAVLNQIGFAGACLARELPDKSLELIDGHLRKKATLEKQSRSKVKS